MYGHIVSQLTKFINGLDNPKDKEQVIEELYDEINKDIVLWATVEKEIKSRDIHYFITRLLLSKPEIVIIIDNKVPKVVEACRLFKYPVTVIEFKVFAIEDAPNIHAYLFEVPHAARESVTREKKYLSWEEKLEQVEKNVRDFVQTLTEKIVKLGNVRTGVKRDEFYFYKGEPGSRTLFAVFMLTQKALNVRIRVNPETFSDPLNWTKVYKGWFFKKEQERGFRIESKDQIPYAMKLIKQSYDAIAEQ